ncbi:carbon-nitrogen hydrolase family protein [Fodinicurvata sp. EGI_FJ10296]|uniref:carbon-nitrogen hydrolase family protein n=1 Tax=Fodinicurvata sp. EGI_FJ10296 TaxID=3231908 RepID=UPI0034530951
MVEHGVGPGAKPGADPASEGIPAAPTRQQTLRLAMAQMCSGKSHAPNVAAVTELAGEAAAKGAELLALPEVGGLVNKDHASAREMVTVEEADPYVAACRALAARHGLWINTGSTPVVEGADPRFINRGHLIDPTGAIVARYDKIHLFDVDLPGEKPRRESDRFRAGDEAVMAATPWGAVALSICYDLRFPHLYRAYAKAGASILFIPSAFTVPTGEAHWEPLLRARAIENGCFVVAPAQGGAHDDGRHTWGHSMVVDPWGRVLVDMETSPGLSVVDLDLSAVAAARRSIPSLVNERPFRFVTA